MLQFLHFYRLVPDLYHQLSSRLSASQVGLGLPHTLRSKGILVEDVDLHDTLGDDVKEELGVVTAFHGSDQVAPQHRTDEFDVLLCKFEEREWRGRAGSVAENNDGSFPLQQLEVIFEAGRGGLGVVH